MGHLASLPGNGKTFLLVDGAKVNNLSQVIYREIETPLCDALYRGTELADLLEISPWLIETGMDSSLALKCFEEWKHQGLPSCCGLTAILTKSWTTCVDCLWPGW